jgi:Aspartyl/Asparaginyl beta-hydroxylase
MLWRKVRKVDISSALAQLPHTRFIDSGGSNGWLAHEPWVREFGAGLNLGGIDYAVCRKLPPWQGIPQHIDADFPGVHRYHVPLLTHPDVKMRWPADGVEVHLEAGWLYEVCFTKLHEIVHRAPVDRIHLHYNVVER